MSHEVSSSAPRLRTDFPDRFVTDDPEVKAIYAGIDSILGETTFLNRQMRKGLRRKLRAMVWRELMDGPPPE